jgi:hypothetical protein
MVFQKHTSLCAAMFLAFVPTLSDANSAVHESGKKFQPLLRRQNGSEITLFKQIPECG